MTELPTDSEIPKTNLKKTYGNLSDASRQVRHLGNNCELVTCAKAAPLSRHTAAIAALKRTSMTYSFSRALNRHPMLLNMIASVGCSAGAKVPAINRKSWLALRYRRTARDELKQ
jgi:hypothetical protein